MRILVIDDNPDDRLLELREVHALFPEAELLELTSLDEFEAALASGPPDLVLTDLDLRWSNGREVLLSVKARYPACPVVMFTGTGNETIAVELMKDGLDDYVVKSPSQLPRLRTSLKIAVEMAKSREALSDREAHLARALAQQQLVVRELHHRVKNNLQTVTSLLRMRARTVDATTRGHLDEIAGRMQALGAVQSRIYEAAEFDRVDFRAALGDIAASLLKDHADAQVTLTKDLGAPLVMDVARAMPLSLICYEIILKALKHAWPAGPPSTLTVQVVTGVRGPEIRITDDGVGFVDQNLTTGLRGQVFRSIAQEAEVEYGVVTSPGSGTRVSLRLL